MSFAYALTWFCDAMLYYGAIGCMGLLRACRAGLVGVPLALLAACWLSGRLTGGDRPPWLRWAPMAMIVPAMLLAGNAVGQILSIPMTAYLPLYVYNNRRAPDYDCAADRFRHSLIAAGLCLLLAMLLRASSWKKGLPYLFAYFTLNMALLRLLRHDDLVARSRRFRLLNLGGVALVCAAGFALSQPGVVAVVLAGWRWFVDNVVVNLAVLLLYLVQLVLYAGAWLISRLPGRWIADFAQIPPPNLRVSDAPPMQQAAAELTALNPLVRFLLQAAGLALAALALFMILRALSRRTARTASYSPSEQRESLDAEGPSPARPIRLRRAPEDGVRQQYRRALALVRARGGRVSPAMNTEQIERANAGIVDPAAMAELRQIYLPVRYGGRRATKADAARAKQAVKRL